MAIWDFNNEEQFPTPSLERVLEIDDELKNLLGESPLDEDMITEIIAELNDRNLGPWDTDNITDL